MIKFSMNKIVFHSLHKNLLHECEICISPIQLTMCNGKIYKTIFLRTDIFWKATFHAQFNPQMNIETRKKTKQKTPSPPQISIHSASHCII